MIMQEIQTTPGHAGRRVIWSVTPDQTRSPYISDIERGLREAGWTVDKLSLRDLASTTGQIVHIQWPEHVSRSTTPAKTVAKHVRAVGLLAAIKLRRHHVVVTAHNVAPHGESDPFDEWFRAQILRLAEIMIVLVPDHERELRRLGQIHPELRVVTSRQPIVPEAPAEDESAASDRESLLILGRIHPYHRILEFVDALIALGSTRPVEIVGSVGDGALVEALHQRATQHDWLTVSPGYISDEDIVPLIARTSAVVSLQRTPFNSGAPFFALARERPVILTTGAQAKLLAEEVGSDWVFEVPEDEQSLDIDALDAWLNAPRPTPTLDRYTLDAVACEHGELYELLLRER